MSVGDVWHARQAFVPDAMKFCFPAPERKRSNTAVRRCGAGGLQGRTRRSPRCRPRLIHAMFRTSHSGFDHRTAFTQNQVGEFDLPRVTLEPAEHAPCNPQPEWSKPSRLEWGEEALLHPITDAPRRMHLPLKNLGLADFCFTRLWGSTAGITSQCYSF